MKRTDAESPDLAVLVPKAQAGDVESFHALYGFYGKKILNYLYRMTGSREEAEDLMQETFVLAYKNLGALKEPVKFQSWLYRIAQNNVYQRYRGKRPRMETIEDTEKEINESAYSSSSSQKNPEESVLSDELQSVVQKVIGDLPQKYREVFVLSAVQKLSYESIATIVGRSLASVKSDIHRARVEVRDRVKDYLGDNYGMSNLR